MDRQMPTAAIHKMDELREITGKVAGTVFFGTLLKSMRESSMNGPHGHGGRGEEVFAERLHGILAQQLGASMQGGLSESLYRSLSPQLERLNAMTTQTTPEPK
jgi:Rod binding domain-containing protein